MRYRPAIQKWTERVRLPNDPNGCWEWAGALDWDGYGHFSERGRNITAHRFAYELFVGPIPPGLEPDHTCRNRACQNPAHLDLVTHRVNVLRGESPAAIYARRTHCPRGHPLIAANLVRGKDKRRRCRLCVNLRYHERRKERTP